jgi:hypothetical protein
MNFQNLHILNVRILLDLSSVTTENDTQRKRERLGDSPKNTTDCESNQMSRSLRTKKS